MTLLHQAAQKAVEALNHIVRRLQMDIDDGGRPDQWSMEDLVRKAQPAIDALVAALQHQEVPREPVAWIRWCSDGGYEGPIMNHSMEEVRKRSGAWTPLYASPSTTRQQEVGSRVQYRHKRTGGLYAVIGTAKLQTDKPLFDMAEVVAYRGEDGRVWVRAAAEFDERFERAAAPSTPENADGGPHG